MLSPPTPVVSVASKTAFSNPLDPRNVLQPPAKITVTFVASRSELQEVWDLVIEDHPQESVACFVVKVEPEMAFQHTAEVRGASGVVRTKLAGSPPRAGSPPGGGSPPVAGELAVAWDGKDDKGADVPPGKYRIRLTATARGSSASADSDEIKIVRVGVVGVSYSETDKGPHVYALKYAFKEFPAKFDLDNFDVPARQWKLASLDDGGKPRTAPQAATGRGTDPNTYCYPIAAKIGEKLKPKMEAAGTGYAAGDGISLRLVEPGTTNAWSDDQAKAIEPAKFYPLLANDKHKLPDSVDKAALQFDFRFEYVNSKKKTILLGRQRCSKTVVYALVSEPQEPWGWAAGRERPWVELLEKVCPDWAKGAKTVEAAAGKIVEAVNGKMTLVYDTVHGADINSLVTRVADKPDSMQLRDFMRWLAGISTRPPKWNTVNCTCCGALVTTIANVTGCLLSSSQMGWDFGCHKIISIGDTAWHHPFHNPADTSGGFSYHEVGWTGGGGDSDKVYDACLKAANDPVSAPATSPLLPKGVTYATSSTAIDDYRRRLVVPGSVATTKSQPATAGKYKPK